jgi:hypothetical protein
MPDKNIEELTIKELTDRLGAINQERDAIVKVIQDAADAVGIPSNKPAPKVRKPRQARSSTGSGTTTAEKFQAALADSKTIPTTAELIKAVVDAGANKGTAQQFPYSKAGKALLKKTDAGWKLK